MLLFTALCRHMYCKGIRQGITKGNIIIKELHTSVQFIRRKTSTYICLMHSGDLCENLCSPPTFYSGV